MGKRNKLGRLSTVRRLRLIEGSDDRAKAPKEAKGLDVESETGIKNRRGTDKGT